LSAVKYPRMMGKLAVLDTLDPPLLSHAISGVLLDVTGPTIRALPHVSVLSSSTTSVYRSFKILIPPQGEREWPDNFPEDLTLPSPTTSDWLRT